MEVSQAKLEQAQARDALTKARVTIHSFQTARVQAEIQPGLQVAAKTLQAGKQALAERRFRRLGLAVSVLAIAVVLVVLRLYIRELESAGGSAK